MQLIKIYQMYDTLVSLQLYKHTFVSLKVSCNSIKCDVYLCCINCTLLLKRESMC